MFGGRCFVILVSIACGWLAACRDGSEVEATAQLGADAGLGLVDSWQTIGDRVGSAAAVETSDREHAGAQAGASGSEAAAQGGAAGSGADVADPASEVMGPVTEPATAAPVTFDPPGGGFVEPFELQLRARVASAVIHYTLDGSLPTADSPVYSAPIAVSETTLVRALAVGDVYGAFAINQSYVHLTPEVEAVDSNLPLVVVHMLGAAPPVAASHEFTSAVFAVFEPGAGRARLNTAATWTGRLGVKVRGRSSRYQTKPSYTIEVRGDDTEDLPLPLLGLPSEGDWVLYAPYKSDRSLVRNALMYELSRRIGRYAPRTRFCELYFVANHAELQAADYAGVYVLTERLTRGDARIDVHKLKPSAVTEPAVTGGYIVKVDDPDMPSEGFSAAGRTFVYVDPSADEIVPQQTAYLTEYLDSWQRAISAADGFDPETGNAYAALMDIPSFIDHHILNMLAKNPDAFVLSAYHSKDRGGPLRAGPVWDQELGVGNADDVYRGMQRSLDPTHWGPTLGDELFTRKPYDALFAHPEFAEAYWARWQELLASTLTPDTVREVLAGYAAELHEAEQRNRARWPEMAPESGNLEAELDQVGNWVEARLQWISTQIGVLP